jgi:transposase
MKIGYDIKLRERVVQLVLEPGKSRREASEVFGVHDETVRNGIKLYPETGQVVSKASQPEIKPDKLNWEAGRTEVEEQPDLSRAERAQKLGVVTSSRWYALTRMGIRRKKKGSPTRNQI